MVYSRQFCQLYDEFGWNEYPRTFGKALLKWLDQNGYCIHSVLDLGCGTGVLCALFHAHGLETLGIDLSPEMIAIARERSPSLRFEEGNMVHFVTDRLFDLVTCTGDALNHITDPNDIRKVFSNVHNALKPGGLFVFDLLKAEEVPQGEPFEADFTDQLRIRFSASRDADGFTRLQVEGYESDNNVFSDVIKERVYELSDVRDTLHEMGFTVLQCDDRLISEGDAHGTTWFVIAKKDLQKVPTA